MRIAIAAALCLGTGAAFAQTTPPPTKDSPNATGRTMSPRRTYKVSRKEIPANSIPDR
jgi:hypothetical protein